VAILFPFVRSQISLITSQPGMMPVIIPAINVNALLDESEQAGAAKEEALQ
jgi:preprotein translocase subunit SecB